MFRPTRSGHFRVLDQTITQIMSLIPKETDSHKRRSSPTSLESPLSDIHSTREIRIQETYRPTEEEKGFPVKQDDGPPVDRGRQAWGYVSATFILETVIWVSLSIIELPLFLGLITSLLYDVYAGVRTILWRLSRLLYLKDRLWHRGQRLYPAASCRYHQPWNDVLPFAFNRRPM